MNRAQTVAWAYLTDRVIGDPEGFPHPVRLIGKVCELGEGALRKPGQSAMTELVAGAALAAGMTVVVYAAADAVLRCARRVHPEAEAAVGVVLAWTCLATRSLKEEADAVLRAAERDDLPLARRRLARIVGRDTHALDEAEICRAVIETVAESASDGIVAPLFYLAIGGVPMAMAYKAVNTLDSMIGHANERYFYFGKVAARLDDAANYLPARLTALLIATVASLSRDCSGKLAVQTWKRDGGKHRSPNAGQPESAMAGALQVRLGGDNTYGGETVSSAFLGEEFPPPSLADGRRCARLMVAVSVLGALSAVLLARRGR